MGGFDENCIINTSMKGGTGRVCVGQWQEVEKGVDLRCVVAE